MFTALVGGMYVCLQLGGVGCMYDVCVLCVFMCVFVSLLSVCLVDDYALTAISS